MHEQSYILGVVGVLVLAELADVTVPAGVMFLLVVAAAMSRTRRAYRDRREATLKDENLQRSNAVDCEDF